MSASDLLSQDEIDALLHGVDNGDVETDDPQLYDGDARSYDFASQDRIVRGRLPTLEMINERFARYYSSAVQTVTTAVAVWPFSPGHWHPVRV